MSKIKPLVVSLLTLLLIPTGYALAQEEGDYAVDDPVLYQQEEAPDYGTDETYEYDYDFDWDGYAEDLYTIQDDIAQDSAAGFLGMGAMFAFLAAYSFIVIAIGLASYIFSSLALYKIGKEMNYQNSWFAWVPILNTIMLFKLGDQNPMLLLLLLIPGLGAFVVAILSIIALANITEKRGYEKILVLLVLIPVGMYILLYLLAWKPKTAVQPTA